MILLFIMHRYKIVMGAGIPWSDVNLQKLEGTPPVWSASSSLSEVTSLTLEFFTLGSAMGEPLPALTEKKRKEKKRKEKKRKEKKRKEKKRKEKKRKEKTTPFGVDLMKSQVLYRAAQGQP